MKNKPMGYVETYKGNDPSCSCPVCTVAKEFGLLKVRELEQDPVVISLADSSWAWRFRSSSRSGFASPCAALRDGQEIAKLFLAARK